MNLHPFFVHRFSWLKLPLGLLVVLLQRTPAVRVVTGAVDYVVASPVGQMLRAAVTVAALGAMHSRAGATQFVISPAPPMSGTVGTPISPISFTYNGTPTPPARFDFIGTLPPGLNFIPAPSGSTIPSGTPVIAGTPTQAGSFSVSVRGFQSAGIGSGVLHVIDFEIAGGAGGGPAISSQPAHQSATAGGSATFSVTVTGATGIQWRRNGVAVAGATNATLAIANVQPANAGLYTAVASGSGDPVTSAAAILGVSTTTKVIGNGSEIGQNIVHPNDNIFDQILAHGAAAAFTADPGQVTRLSYIDLNDDIVQVEFAGAGTVSIVFEGSSGPGNPTKYNQDLVGAGFPGYIKGHAGIVVTGADETTNLSVFTVGRATAFDPTGAYNILQGPSATNVPANNGSSLFAGHAATSYNGLADIAFVAIASTNGKFGGLRTANAVYWATSGFTGVYAPGVEFTGPVFVGDINAMAAEATPGLQIGGTSGDNRTWVTGGDLKQDNGKAVRVSGITQLHFRDGSDSHGNVFAAKANQAVLEQNGVNVTTQIVVNP